MAFLAGGDAVIIDVRPNGGGSPDAVRYAVSHFIEPNKPVSVDELRERLVFVGGCTTALYITDPVTLEGVRATDDVDLIVDLAGFA